MEILSAVAVTVLESLVAPIGRELGSIFFYKKNIKDLEEQFRSLGDSRERVQSIVNVARSNAYEIHKDVLTWLEKVDSELLLRPQQNDEGGSNRNHSNLSCLNLIQCQPRKIKKRTKYILQLIDDGKKFDKDTVGYPAPLPSTKCSTLPTNYQILESRTLMAEKIKNALADPNVNKVGVCGMGGVGKTKLLDEVKKLVLENNLFHRVIIVTVGTSKGGNEIQDEIVGMLNMNLNTSTSKEVRASHLQTNLMEVKENILIMLDDLWKEYDLEKEFGIPCRSKSRTKGCKILMTGRSQDVFTNQMNTEKLFEVNPLSDEEAWKFFVAIVGESVHQDDIKHIARDVVKECGGLPIALNIIAKALKGRKVDRWEGALKKLKKHVLVGIPGVNNELYTCLKISYDSIENEAKLLFCLCSVFLDDQRIWMKDLQMYAMGMGLLNDIEDWEDARNRVIKLVDDLKSSYLLLKSDEGDDYVQMHDVVRDVAKYIALEIDKMPSLSYGYEQSEWREEDRRGSYKVIFVDCENFSNLPSKLEFPNLQLLILRGKAWNKTQIPNAFFEAMENLRVLDMKNMSFEPSKTLLTGHSIKNLQTLCMSYCECYDIDTICELKKLKILRIIGCMIQELPKTMSQLTELKILEVLCCDVLKVIHPNIISSMKKLEELSLWSNFKRWGEEVSFKNKLITNVKLYELNCLTHLSTLRLEILNVDILLNELSFERAQNLKEFYICVGGNYLLVTTFNSSTYGKNLVLNIKSKIVFIGGVLEILLQRCENLRVRDSVAFTKALLKSNGNYYGYSRLKHLDIDIVENSDMPHQIIRNITPLFDVQVSFPELKDLIITQGNNLEALWHNNRINANSCCKLQNIYITSCNKLTYLFPSHMVASLVSLNTLEVKDCELLERIFEIEELTDDAKVVPLTQLILYSLPNLKYVWNNDSGEFLTFPNLKDVRVENCPQLESLFPASFIKHMEEIEDLNIDLENEIFAEDEASKLVLPEIVSFPSLRTLRIKCKVVEKRSFWVRSVSFPKLRSLHLFGSEDDNMVSLPIEMSELLYTIEELTISRAIELVQVFQNGEENNQRRAKLERLYLYDLPKLMHLWEETSEMISASCFDSLEDVDVRKCENLKCLLPSSITFFNLTDVQVRECNGMMNLFSSSVAKRLVNLRSMEISDCEGMSSIVVAEGEEEELITFNRMNELRLQNLPRLVGFHTRKCTLEFPCLEHVVVSKCENLKCLLPSSVTIFKLIHVEVSECNGMMNLFSSSVAKRLMNLRSMKISNCEGLSSIVVGEGEEGEEEEEEIIIFNRMNELRLRNLPRLVSFHTRKCTLEFPCLEDIVVSKCENLKCLLPSSLTFFNLTDIQVSECNGMMNLFSSSVAKSLLNLKSMEISDCQGMSSIVNVVEGEEEEIIIFNRMKKLTLENLQRLSSFHTRKCRLEFPYLEFLKINGCPEMKTFSYGIISTPRLQCMFTDECDIPVSPKQDINLIIQTLFTHHQALLEFPYLEELEIKGCPKMKTFSYGIISPPALQFVLTGKGDFRVSPAQDINLIIQNLFTQHHQGEGTVKSNFDVGIFFPS